MASKAYFLAAILVLGVSVAPAAASLEFVTSYLQSMFGMNQDTPDEWPPAFCNDLDCPKYTVIETSEDYEVRSYDASKWVTTSLTGVSLDAAGYTMFMRLFRYIGGANANGVKIEMTCPVITRIIPAPGPACESNFTMSFFVSPKEGTPPAPTDSTVYLSDKETMTVYVKSFGGFAKQADWIKHAADLADALPEGTEHHKDFYYTAGYDAPFKLFNRHNEVWFIGV